jgi:hypothetical protein
VLESNNQEQLIFKHAISTVVLGKGIHHSAGHTAGQSAERQGPAAVSAPAAATGTSGSGQ